MGRMLQRGPLGRNECNARAASYAMHRARCEGPRNLSRSGYGNHTCLDPVCRGPNPRRYGVEKGWSPSGGLIWGPRAASWGLSSVFSLLSSLSSLRSSLFCSHCCSFLRSHFAPVPSIFATGHRLRPQLLLPFAAPSLARRNARSD